MINDKQINNNLSLMVDLERRGFKFIKNTMSKKRLLIGGVLLGVALIPNGLGLVAYPLSFMVLGINIIDIKQYVRESKRKIKVKIKCLQWSLYNGY